MRFYFLVIINLFAFILFAQKQNALSHVENKVPTANINYVNQRADTATINHINKLAEDNFESYPDSTLYYGNLEVTLSKKTNYLLGTANGYLQLGSVYLFKGDYTASNQTYKIALPLFQTLNSTYGISECYIGLARTQDFLGNYTEALKLLKTALSIRIKDGNQANIADCYNITGITYDNKGDFSKALDYYFKALIINIKQKDELSAADNYLNIGVIMQHLDLYDKAYSYFTQGLTIWQKHKDQQGISTAYENMGEVLLAQKKYAAALPLLKSAETSFQALDDQDGISLVNYDLGLYNYYTHNNAAAVKYFNDALQSASHNKLKYNKAYALEGLARVYNADKQFAKAYGFAKQAESIAKEIGSLNTKACAALQVSVALAGLRRFKEAYVEHQLYSRIKDSLNNNASLDKLITYNLEVDFLKKKKEIDNFSKKQEKLYQQKIARQKKLSILYVSIIVVVTTLLVIYYNAKQKQQHINKLLAQKNDEITAHQDNLDQQALKLNNLNLLKDRLIAVLAHDLRAPISTLRGLFNLMADNNLTREEFIDMIPTVFKQLEHTSDFLDTLLFWINSEVADSGNKMESFNLHEVVNKELNHMEGQFIQKDIRIKVIIESGITAYAEHNSVRIVVHNFLTNAVKFSNRGGLITIEAFKESTDIVQFSVKDDGIGMSDEYMANLFKTRVVSAPGTDNEIGTGMGLLFCKDLIEKNNGTIWVKSEMGNGTQLGFNLPKGFSNFCS